LPERKYLEEKGANMFRISAFLLGATLLWGDPALASPPLRAPGGDIRVNYSVNERVSSAPAGSSFPAHQGGAPWSFTVIEEPSSTFVVNDTDSSTIDFYLFRSEGPIIIDVPVHRYVGETDATAFCSTQATWSAAESSDPRSE
jgi:hypothetical protein